MGEIYFRLEELKKSKTIVSFSSFGLERVIVLFSNAILIKGLTSCIKKKTKNSLLTNNCQVQDCEMKIVLETVGFKINGPKKSR
ncbi:hypothetical protein N9K77_02065 [bacterium]|nr:hypothetical protein [bacterium]